MTDNPIIAAKGDVVLQEVWRAKDALSAASGGNFNAFFENLQKREAESGREFVNFCVGPNPVPKEAKTA